jgi:hypothetical protein
MHKIENFFLAISFASLASCVKYETVVGTVYSVKNETIAGAVIMAVEYDIKNREQYVGRTVSNQLGNFSIRITTKRERWYWLKTSNDSSLAAKFLGKRSLPQRADIHFTH